MDTLATLQVYKELADWYERQGQAAMRDRFLILAAEAAFSGGNPEEAERLRQRLLQGNPHHMLKPFSSFAQALQSTNIQIYIHDLQVNYPPQTAEGLLQDLRSGAASSPPPAEAGVEETLGMVPQKTTPIIEIRDDATLPLGTTIEPLKVYPLRDEPEPPAKPVHGNRPAPRKEPAPPAPPKPAVKPTHLNRPAPRKPAPAPVFNPPPRSQPALPRPAAPVADPALAPPETTAPAGAWLPLLLFGMIVTAGIVLAFYTLARPFLPAL
jgi:hypothetical protein